MLFLNLLLELYVEGIHLNIYVHYVQSVDLVDTILSRWIHHIGQGYQLHWEKAELAH